jgi:hypothetical protein
MTQHDAREDGWIDKLISEYRSAYTISNGCEAPCVTYTRGWFRVGHPSTPYRRKKIEQMRDTLLSRANPPSPRTIQMTESEGIERAAKAIQALEANGACRYSEMAQAAITAYLGEDSVAVPRSIFYLGHDYCRCDRPSLKCDQTGVRCTQCGCVEAPQLGSLLQAATDQGEG